MDKAYSKAFRTWLKRGHDVEPNEVDKNLMPLYLESYEQERYEQRMAAAIR